MAKLLDGTRIYGTANVDTQVNVGANVYVNTSAVAVVNTTGNSILTPVTFAISNTSAAVHYANLTGIYSNGIINAATHTAGAPLAGTGGFYANTTTLVVGNNTVNSTITSLGLNVNGSIITNTAGVFVVNTTGVVNAFSHSVGTIFIANTTILTFTPNTFNLGSVTKAAAGYVWLPNGVLRQWGTATANNSVGNVTFPIAFTTACQSVTLGVVGSANVAYHAAAANTTVAQIRTTSTTTAISVYWEAIGY